MKRHLLTREMPSRHGFMGTVSSAKLHFFLCLVLTTTTLAQTNSDQSPTQLKKLSLEQLMDVEVTTVSKRPEKLTESASAIQVISQEEIRRSGVTSIPEALR